MLINLIFVIKIAYAAVLGFILGVQREKAGKAAGSRTYSLVTLGACVFTIVSAQGFLHISQAFDPSRIASGIVTGIGFLGAGLIIFQDDKLQGLTTAAGLWAAAALGVIVGIGWWLEAAVLTLVIWVLLYLAKIQERRGWLKK